MEITYEEYKSEYLEDIHLEAQIEGTTHFQDNKCNTGRILLGL